MKPIRVICKRWSTINQEMHDKLSTTVDINIHNMTFRFIENTFFTLEGIIQQIYKKQDA